MSPLSFARHQFPPAIIQHAIWLYLRFTLSYRDVEELLAERGIDVSYETVRRWVVKFGPAIAGNLRHLRPKPSPRWHLDEMVIRVSGRLMYLWRAVDDEGEVLDKLRFYRAAFREIGLTAHHEQGWRTNNRAEVSHQPVQRRERNMQRFKSTRSAQLFVCLHAAVYNCFNLQRHMVSRRTLRTFRAQAMAAWQFATAVT
ncbi:IS6 family transposase [Azospirillum sp. TSA6c]|uniref:IS6 family transposase n=1 Tax=unclassified Azospirillum TaxID=2630922 RepID=UPI000D606825|nr:IS6 family transposase [Azospirillum sp. TSA6c]PWC53358.1 hypothetical protein TSA6c_02505 [Azospirillum sp. TSA6c]